MPVSFPRTFSVDQKYLARVRRIFRQIVRAPHVARPPLTYYNFLAGCWAEYACSACGSWAAKALPRSLPSPLLSPIPFSSPLPNPLSSPLFSFRSLLLQASCRLSSQIALSPLLALNSIIHFAHSIAR